MAYRYPFWCWKIFVVAWKMVLWSAETIPYQSLFRALMKCCCGTFQLLGAATGDWPFSTCFSLSVSFSNAVKSLVNGPICVERKPE